MGCCMKHPKMKSSTKSILNKSNCAGFMGILALTLSILLSLFKPELLQLILSSVLVLKPNSPIVNDWLKTPLQIPTNAYFFNWTNPEEFYNISIKPKFEQLGPYQFMQDMEKVNVVWNDNNTVTYNQVRTWHFNEKHTNGSLSDNVTTLNFIAASFAHYANTNWNYFMKKVVSVMITAEAPEIPLTKTVNELLIDGFDDPFNDLSHYLPFVEPDFQRMDKLGWVRMRNKSVNFDGIFNKGTGVDGDFDIHSWNYNNVTRYFDGSCANVQGSDGELNSYKVGKDYIDLFASDICRYLRLDFIEEVKVKGILGYKYSIGKSVLDNETPENKCFCNGNCIPSGMLNVSSCRHTLPLFASLPHFYAADLVYLNAVEGLHPEKAKHESYIVLEPKTSVLLQVAARAQMNILLHPIEDIRTYKNVREIYFPHFWAEQNYTIEGYTELLLRLFLYAPYIFGTISIVLATTGFYLIVFVAYKPVFISLYKKLRHRRKNESKTLRPEEVPLKK